MGVLARERGRKEGACDLRGEAIFFAATTCTGTVPAEETQLTQSLHAEPYDGRKARGLLGHPSRHGPSLQAMCWRQTPSNQWTRRYDAESKQHTEKINASQLNGGRERASNLKHVPAPERDGRPTHIRQPLLPSTPIKLTNIRDER